MKNKLKMCYIWSFLEPKHLEYFNGPVEYFNGPVNSRADLAVLKLKTRKIRIFVIYSKSKLKN